MTSDWDLETDVVVVGGGGCGLMAAFAAARQGVEVLLLEKDSRLGCNTDIASGSIAAAGTRFQRAHGIESTPEEMADDILRKNHGRADREIVLTLCRSAVRVVDLFVDEVGLPLELNTVGTRAGQSSLRLHNPLGRSGAPLTQALRSKLGRMPNCTLADRTPGAGLLADDRGAVIGVRAGVDGEQRIGARKVILATDGFGANKSMLRTYIPEMVDVEYIGAQGNTGDGIRWAVDLGAAVAHMGAYQGHGYLCAGYGTRLMPEMPFLGAIIVNANGERFDREDQGYSELAAVLLRQPRGVGICIFDQRIHDALASTNHFKDSIAAGALRQAASLDALAAAFRIDPARLRATFDAYYAGVRANRDPFGRTAFGEPLAPPYYGATITGGLAHTQGGVVVDVHARVVHADGHVIPNLYAGGGTAAGVSGDGADGYLSGNGLLTAFGFGLIAGEHAAAAIGKP